MRWGAILSCAAAKSRAHGADGDTPWEVADHRHARLASAGTSQNFLLDIFHFSVHREGRIS